MYLLDDLRHSQRGQCPLASTADGVNSRAGHVTVNARLRKVTRNRGQFPTEQAALKVLYLAVRNLADYQGPNTGIRSSGWKQALQVFSIYFDGRIPTP